MNICTGMKFSLNSTCDHAIYSSITWISISFFLFSFSQSFVPLQFLSKHIQCTFFTISSHLFCHYQISHECYVEHIKNNITRYP